MIDISIKIYRGKMTPGELIELVYFLQEFSDKTGIKIAEIGQPSIVQRICPQCKKAWEDAKCSNCCGLGVCVFCEVGANVDCVHCKGTDTCSECGGSGVIE